MGMVSYTPKMQEALLHYSVHGNKTAAYRHAYDCGDMKPATIARRAQDLFTHPLMKSAIDSMRAAAMAQMNINAEWVLYRAQLLADFNISKFIVTDDHGNACYDFTNASDDDWYCISEYTVDEIAKGAGKARYYVDQVKLKTHCKLRALELVGKHVNVNAFKENVDVNGAILLANVPVEDYLKARREVIEHDDC